MHKSSFYLSWTLLAAALALWSGVGFFVWTLASEQTVRTSRIVEAEQQALEHATALRFHALARETRIEREKLEELASANILDIIGTIERVADDAEISVKIGQILGASQDVRMGIMRSISLTVEAESSFSQVIRLTALLDSLEIPARVTEVNFQRIRAETKSVNPRWNLVVRMQFLTTEDIES